MVSHPQLVHQLLLGQAMAVVVARAFLVVSGALIGGSTGGGVRGVVAGQASENLLSALRTLQKNEAVDEDEMWSRNAAEIRALENLIPPSFLELRVSLSVLRALDILMGQVYTTCGHPAAEQVNDRCHMPSRLIPYMTAIKHRGFSEMGLLAWHLGLHNSAQRPPGYSRGLPRTRV